MDSVISVVWALIGVGFLIFVHELGHFLAAKRVGIRVETFALGFQPTIFGFKARFCAFTWGETEYVIGMVPFGGYVKMAGEELTDEKTGAGDEFGSKKPSERALVLVAGSVMNLIFGFLFFIVAYAIGVPVLSTSVGMLAPHAPAWDAGLLPGDHIVGVNGTPIDEFMELRTKVALSSAGEPMTLSVRRNQGEPQDFIVVPRYDETVGWPSIGVGPGVSSVVGEIESGSAAELAGLAIGDRIVRIRSFESDGTTFEFPADLPAPWVTAVLGRIASRHARGIFLAEVQSGDSAPREVSLELQSASSVDSSPRSGVEMAARVVSGIAPASRLAGHFEEGQEIVAVAGKTVWRVDPAEIAQLPAGDIALQTADGKTITVDRDTLATCLWTGELVMSARRRSPPSDKEQDPSRKNDAQQQDTPQIIGRVIAGSAADIAGLQPGDRVLQVGATDIASFEDYRNAVVVPIGEKPMPLTIQYSRGGEEASSELLPAVVGGVHGITWLAEENVRQASILEACGLGYSKTILWIQRVFLTLRSLIASDVSATNLSGPVGIIMMAKSTFSAGAGRFLYFLALISVNLGVFNLLPFPILDGGHLAFLAIEKVKGSPVSDQVMHYSHLVAFLMLISMAIFVTFNDIQRFFLR